MRALRFRKLLLILIGLKFLDIITTITGVTSGSREINPLGYDIVIVVSILYMIFLFWIAKYYYIIPNFRNEFSSKRRYKALISWVTFLICIYTFVVISNISQLISR